MNLNTYLDREDREEEHTTNREYDWMPICSVWHGTIKVKYTDFKQVNVGEMRYLSKHEC